MYRARSLPFVLAIAFAALAALSALPQLAYAAEITVDTTADQAPSTPECTGAPGDCSLRQAIDQANKNSPGADTIVLPVGHYGLTIKGSEEDEAATGDLDVTKESAITIRGAGARSTVVDATGLGDRVFDVLEGGSLALSGLTVTGGEAVDVNGGGIRAEGASLSLEAVAVRGNVSSESGYGGGLNIEEKSNVSIVNSLLAENRNSGDGGALYSDESQLTIVNTTLANNVVDTALYPKEPGWGAYGGGAEVNKGTLRMQNVTVFGNSIRDGNGGGQGYGTGLAVYVKDAEVLNTIVFGNQGSEVEETGQCDEPILSGGHNLEAPPPTGEPRCFSAATDLIGDPLLEPLANNGGQTDTMALPLGSPALNAGDPARCPATDQRGFTRPQLGGCDIGAFERLSPLKIRRRGKVHVKRTGKTFLVKPGFRVSCPSGGEACVGSIKAIKKGLIGKKKFKVASGKTKALALRLNHRGAKLLDRFGKLKTKFEVTCRANGKTVKAKAKLKLKLPLGSR
jgi:hypothetical protein